MKTKKFIIAALAVLGLAACKPETPQGPASVVADKAEITFGVEGGEQTITINSNVDWALRDYNDAAKEWLVIDPEKGSGSASDQVIRIKALKNDGAARQATITFFGNVLAKAPVTISQEGKPVGVGSGTLDDPYDAAAANAYISTLAADAESAGNIYVKGTVVEVKEAFSSYGNCTIYLGSEGSDERFYVFRALGLGNKKCTDPDAVKVGDEVIVCGKVVNYKGNTPETVQNAAYLYSINGNTGSTTPDVPAGEPKGTGTQSDPYNVTAANAYTSALAADAESTSDIYIKGKITAITDPFGSYGNCTMSICNEDADATAGQVETFAVYRTYGPGNQKCSDPSIIKVGDIVVICGKVVNYKGNTPETVQNKSYIYSINGNTGSDTPAVTPGTPKGSGTEADPYNASAALAAAKALAADASTENEVYIKGFVKGAPSFSASYGDMTFNLVDEKGGNTEPFFVYQLLSAGGAKFASADALKDGDEILLLAKLTNYKGNTPETVKGGKAISINGNTEIGGGDNGGGDNGGGNTGDVSLTPGENEVLYALTLEEITNLLKTETGSAYKTLTIPSAGGNWTGNIMTSSSTTALTYLQFRNNNASFLTSPAYASNVKRVVIVATESKFKQTQDKTLRVAAVPVVDPGTLPTGKDSKGNNITYTDAQMANAYGTVSVATKGGAQTLQMTFNAAAKQFSMLTIDGAMYLDAIYVFCEK